MPITLTSLIDPSIRDFDDIIDVRAPSEFSIDHLPGAINLPVLSDDERVRVGTIYKQVSPFDARKIGAALVARNSARHIEQVLIDRPGSWKPLVYCWRGGQRSGSFATILGQIGWRVETLSGGYKAWRRLVSVQLHDVAFPAPVVLLDGNTGSAKTEVLRLLAGSGIQVLDLEGLARHRGSLFGAMGAQPSQTGFEGALACRIAALDPGRPVVIEAESAKIGALSVPPGVWKAMRTAPRIAIDAPRDERARHLARAYADIIADTSRLAATLERLRPWQPAKRIEAWHGLIAAGEFTALAAELMRWHYDPRYARHRDRHEVPVVPVTAPSLSAESLSVLARQVEEAVNALFPQQEPTR